MLTNFFQCEFFKLNIERNCNGKSPSKFDFISLLTQISLLVSCCHVCSFTLTEDLTGLPEILSSDWIRHRAQNKMPLHWKVIMEEIVFEIKDKRSKWKKLKLFSFTALNLKVRPNMSLEGSNSSIKGSDTKQEEHYDKKK